MLIDLNLIPQPWQTKWEEGWGEHGEASFWNDGTMDVLNSLPKVVHAPTRMMMQQHLKRAT